MKVHEVKTFEFNELNKEAQETALRNYNTDLDYEIFGDNFKESIKEQLAENGFENAEYEEYDLSCYKSRPYINIKSAYIRLEKFLKPSQKWIKDLNNEGWLQMSMYKDEIDFNLEIEKENKLSKRAENIIKVLQEKIQNKFNETIQNLIKSGLEGIRYIESDEAKQDTIEANEYEFLENGMRW